MTSSLTRRRVSIIATGFIGLAVSAAPPVRAADDGYANVFSSLFSAVGVIKPEAAPDIAYRERAPLVLPPQPGLPKPAETANRNPAWPKDPDVARHRREADEARAPQGNRGVDRNDQVSQEELAKGRGTGGDAFQPGDCNVNNSNRNCLLVSPDELKAEGDRFAADNPEKTDEVTAGQEAERVYLTQPPKGYMKATRTVKATAAAPEPRIDESNPRTFLAPPPKTED